MEEMSSSEIKSSSMPDLKYCKACGWPIPSDDIGGTECTGCNILELRKAYLIKDDDDGYPD
jgi:hypothetical protein